MLDSLVFTCLCRQETTEFLHILVFNYRHDEIKPALSLYMNLSY